MLDMVLDGVDLVVRPQTSIEKGSRFHQRPSLTM